MSAKDVPKMPYVRLGNSGLKVSRLILGSMHFGSKEWMPWVLEEEDAIKQIKAAYDIGIQTFDTANIYSNGLSETIVGNAIKKLNLPREEIVVMTKLEHFLPKTGPGEWFFNTGKKAEELGYVNQGGLSRKHIFDAVKASLGRLQLDYVDVLQCHRFNRDTPIEETMTALHDVVKAGYARYIGMGSCYAYQFHQMQNYALTHNLTPFISLQNQYSLLMRDDEIELYPTLKLFGVGSLPWSPLARGHLARPLTGEPPSLRSQTDRFYPMYQLGPWKDDQEIIKCVEKVATDRSVTMAQVALAWLLHQPGVTAPIIGPNSIAQMQDLVGAIQLSLTPGELAFLEEAYCPRPKIVAKVLAL